MPPQSRLVLLGRSALEKAVLASPVGDVDGHTALVHLLVAHLLV